MVAAGSTGWPAAGGVRPREQRRRLDAIRGDDPRRRVVQAFVADVYRSHYDAEVRHWAPTLVTLQTDGRLTAAAGYRRADGPLYLEQYLDAPVEVAIAAATGHEVQRRDICEVAHFASLLPGEGRRMMLLLARHLAAERCRWVVSTATRELRALLVHVGLTPYALAPADPARLAGGAGDWGSYYEHAPVVVAGDIQRGLATLEKRRRV